MTEVELLEILSDTPEHVRRAVDERPQYFLELARKLVQLPPQRLVLVDKEHALPQDFVPDDLVVLDEYGELLTLNRSGLELRAALMPDLLAMAEAARRDGILLPISSTYRSYDYQAGLYRRHVEELGEEEASRVSARPGTSQHQLGTTVDFGSITPAFADTAAGRWLAEHAAEFGFSMSYPKGYENLTGYSWEPWHFRWVGRTATEMEQAFFDGLQQHMLEFWAEHGESLQEKMQ
jgi:D-alanyl-D-alanine carboxypeptidase